MVPNVGPEELPLTAGIFFQPPKSCSAAGHAEIGIRLRAVVGQILAPELGELHGEPKTLNK